MKSDIEIAQASEPERIEKIASKLGLSEQEINTLGKHRGELTFDALKKYEEEEKGNLILVTAMTPTRKGEGKTTVTIGLTQALWKKGEKSTLGIREPSIGPTMGIKGGAAGGGYSQVLPMEDINLHFNGDFHAIGLAHNLMAAMINNHMYQGNELEIDPEKIVWPRVIDMNDRALRNVEVGLDGETGGVSHEHSFGITASSEVMAVLCLAESLTDLKERLSDIIVAYDRGGDPVRISDIGGAGAMAALMKHAFKPNLIQTIEGVPALMHGGPFANIAHGASSLISTKVGMALSDYFVTEAGFGSELGAEKFFDIVCRENGQRPDAAVMVATARALKRQGGVPEEELEEENLEAIREGASNLEKHVENVRKFGVPSVIAINRFPSDTQEEIDLIGEICEGLDVPHAIVEVYQEGGEGGLDLADEVIKICDKKEPNFSPLYPLEDSPEDKIRKIGAEMYGAGEITFKEEAKRDLERIKETGMGDLPICMAKTHSSLSDDDSLLGRPEGFELTIREIKINSGAGFLVPMAGEIMTMPGLPSEPAALDIDIDEDGKISGLF